VLIIKMAEIIDISPDVVRQLTWDELVNGLGQVGLSVTPAGQVGASSTTTTNTGGTNSPIGSDLSSSNYRAGSIGWKLFSNGKLEASDGIFRGNITASTGNIGGWVINSDNITDVAGTTGLSSTVTAGDDIRFWAGHATPSSAPFRVTEAGVLTATSGTIGGWTLAATELSSGKVKLQSTAERILIGDASAPLTGAGIFIGKDGTDYEFRIGDPATKYLHYDGSTGFTLNGAYISQAVLASIASGSALEIQSWQFTGVFSATDYQVVAWTAGTLTLADGTTYAIDAGNTGNMAATTYIYFSLATSTTVLQKSTTASNAVGAGKILIAVANNVASPKDAEFQVFGGTGGTSKLITADNIAASTITADEIAGNTITANKMNVSTLSAIAADLGTITAGNMTINSSGYIKGGQSGYNSGTGFFLGYDTSAYKFSLGDGTSSYLTWDGTQLAVTGVSIIDAPITNLMPIGEDITVTTPVPVYINIPPISSSTNIASNTSQNSNQDLCGVYWQAQTFTVPLTKDQIDSVVLRLSKVGSPSGNLNVAIYATSTNLPAGSALVTKSITATDIVAEGEYTFTFDTPLAVLPGGVYAIVASVPSGNSSNRLNCYYQNTGSPYSGGRFANSSNSGGSWTGNDNYDWYFKVYASYVTYDAGEVVSCDDTTTRKTAYTGFLIETATDGQTKRVQFNGIISGFSDLSVGSTYYLKKNASSTYDETQKTGAGTFNGNITFGESSSNAKCGQSITLDTKFTRVGYVKFNLKKSGLPTDNIVCKICTMADKDTALYTSSLLDGSTLSAADYTEVTFTFTGVDLTASTQYFFKLERTGSYDASNYYFSNHSNATTYGGGSMWILNAGPTWNNLSYDLYFVMGALEKGASGDIAPTAGVNSVKVGRAVATDKLLIYQLAI